MGRIADDAGVVRRTAEELEQHKAGTGNPVMDNPDLRGAIQGSALRSTANIMKRNEPQN